VLAAAMRACVTGEAPWPLFAFGGAGVGKTCAALYLCDRVHGPCMYRDYAALCEELRQAKMGELWTSGTHEDSRVWPEDVWGRWAAAALAVLDEIGTRNVVTDHQYETLKTALDRRERRPLVLLSNLQLDDIARVFDDRIASRCAAGTVVHVVGPDQRLGDTA
jgi:DNA replication protein DnaC